MRAASKPDSSGAATAIDDALRPPPRLYAIVRARRPKLVVETGVHDGLGSAVSFGRYSAMPKKAPMGFSCRSNRRRVWVAHS